MRYIINKIQFLAYFFAYVTFIHCTTTKVPKPFNQRKPVRLAVGTARAVVGLAKGTLKGAPMAAVGGLGVAAGIAGPFWHGGEVFSAGLGLLAKGIASPFQYAQKSFKKGYYRPEYNAMKQEYKAAMAQGNFELANSLAYKLDKLNTDFIRTKKYTKQVQAKQNGNTFSGPGNGNTPNIQHQGNQNMI